MTGWLLSLSLAIAAALFASVGQAGAPGYVAVLDVFGYGPAVIKPVALALTMLVAAIGTFRFQQKGLLKARDWVPFAVLGAPCSVIGGLINMPPALYRIARPVILLAAAFQMARLGRMTAALDARAPEKPPLWPAIFVGGASGLAAGITGIGGGLFVAATMLFLGWAPTKRVAAVAQSSNLYTAAAAFAAIWATHPALPAQLPTWSLAVAVGGLLGTWLGIQYLPAKALRYMLAAILLASGIRIALA
jgi:uncharacterized membrane protein YfcA